MSNSLKLQVMLTAMDKLTTPFKKASKATSQLSQALSQNNGVLRELERTYKQNEGQVKKDAVYYVDEQLDHNFQQETKNHHNWGEQKHHNTRPQCRYR